MSDLDDYLELFGYETAREFAQNLHAIVSQLEPSIVADLPTVLWEHPDAQVGVIQNIAFVCQRLAEAGLNTTIAGRSLAVVFEELQETGDRIIQGAVIDNLYLVQRSTSIAPYLERGLLSPHPSVSNRAFNSPVWSEILPDANTVNKTSIILAALKSPHPHVQENGEILFHRYQEQLDLISQVRVLRAILATGNEVLAYRVPEKFGELQKQFDKKYISNPIAGWSSSGEYSQRSTESDEYRGLLNDMTHFSSEAVQLARFEGKHGNHHSTPLAHRQAGLRSEYLPVVERNLEVIEGYYRLEGEPAAVDEKVAAALCDTLDHVAGGIFDQETQGKGAELRGRVVGVLGRHMQTLNESVKALAVKAFEQAESIEEKGSVLGTVSTLLQKARADRAIRASWADALRAADPSETYRKDIMGIRLGMSPPAAGSGSPRPPAEADFAPAGA